MTTIEKVRDLMRESNAHAVACGVHPYSDEAGHFVAAAYILQGRGWTAEQVGEWAAKLYAVAAGVVELQQAGVRQEDIQVVMQEERRAHLVGNPLPAPTRPVQ